MLSCCWRVWLAFATLMPGRVVGMKSSVPSFNGGMNSLPILWNGIHVSTRIESAPAITGQRHSSTRSMTGR